MIHQAILRHLLIFRTRLAVVAVRIDGNAAARCELAPHLNVFRVHQLDQVIHDDVDAILMEVAVVAEAEQIQLERFAFHHFDIGNVADVNRREIRLAGHRAEARELGAVEFDKVIAVRMLVVEGLQHCRVIFIAVRCFLVAEQCQVG